MFGCPSSPTAAHCLVLDDVEWHAVVEEKKAQVLSKENLRISGEMGLISPKKWTPSLADDCLPHQGKRLAEARRLSVRL
jgi:hypothetical protein